MKKTGLATVILVVGLYAEDFWVKKTYQEWSDKEVNRILTNSPWAKDISASFGMATGTPSGGGRGGGRGGGGSRGGGMGGMGGGGMESSAGGGEGMGGMGGRGGMGGGMGGTPEFGSSAPTVVARVRWQSALPVKQALVKTRLGKEAETSAEAKQFLSREEARYVLVLENLPAGMTRMDPARMREGLKKTTSLARKGKEALHPEDVQFAPTEKSLLIVFLFPKTAPIALEDKEVEFATRLGPMEFKRKFKLQDMVFGGKLEL